MNDVPLGRIAGIRVGMNVFVLALAALITLNMATRILPYEQGGASTAGYWLAGAFAAFCFFLSLLVHELGHALVARDEGVTVQGISLNFIGGVTRMGSIPEAGADLRISVVGPIASATCAVVFLAGAYLLPEGGFPGVLGHVFAWVGVINLIIAGFNMIPAAPLDGGRVLAAAIWRRTGNRSLALTWSAVVGIVAGMVMVTIGIRSFTRADGLSYGPFFFIVGVFIAANALQQLRVAPLYRTLEGVVVAQAMAAGPPSAPAWSTVGDFLRTQPPAEHQAYPVVGPDGQVTGLLTAAAIRAVDPRLWDRLEVRALAYPLERVPIVRVDDPLLAALANVEGGDVHHGLVTDPEGRIVGTLDPSILGRLATLRRAGMEHTGSSLRR
jgi:Zn-dependent protease